MRAVQMSRFGGPDVLEIVESQTPVPGPGQVLVRVAELFELAVAGQLKVTIGGTYSLERAGDAHRALEGRRTTGKLALVP